ncbi:MAG: PhoH family protein, partial [Nitrospirota bacterium]|nr:PhoH family protein [Nitrospirota bacterium]
MKKVKLREGVDLANLYGPRDMHLRLIEDGLKVRLSARGDEVTLEGHPDAVGRAENLLCELAERTIGRRQ